IKSLLRSTRVATRRHRWWRWRGPLDRWNGTSVEHAYQGLHAARIFLVDLLAHEEVDALVPSVLARIDTCLPPEDVRRRRLERLAIQQANEDEEQLDRKRADLKEAMEIAYDAS